MITLLYEPPTAKFTIPVFEAGVDLRIFRPEEPTAEEINAALDLAALTDAGPTPLFDSMPTSEELAADLEAIDPVAILGEGPVADCLAAILRSEIADIRHYRARDYADLVVRRETDLEIELRRARGQI